MSIAPPNSAWLFIDTTQVHHFRFGLLHPQQTPLYTIAKRPHTLLGEIDMRIGRAALSRLVGICIVRGPGAFSATRSGVMTANLLARIYKKPLVGVSVDAAKDILRMMRGLNAGIYSTVSSVQPVYEAEPNIITRGT